MLGCNNNRVLEPGQNLPEVSTHIQSRFPESSKPQEKVETRSNVTEAPTPNPVGTDEPTTDLRNYEVVDDDIALRQKVSDVSTSFFFSPHINA